MLPPGAAVHQTLVSVRRLSARSMRAHLVEELAAAPATDASHRLARFSSAFMAGTAIVTGASGGIRRAVARQLARDRFAIVASSAASASKAEQTVSDVVRLAGAPSPVLRDVALAADVERLSRRPSIPSAARRQWCAARHHAADAARGQRHRCLRQCHHHEPARHLLRARPGGASCRVRRAHHGVLEQRHSSSRPWTGPRVVDAPDGIDDGGSSTVESRDWRSRCGD